MENWEENLAHARMNILRVSDASGECLYKIASNAGIDPDKLRTFVLGHDCLNFGELLKVCKSMEFPFWAILVEGVCMDTGPYDPESNAIENRILAM